MTDGGDAAPEEPAPDEPAEPSVDEPTSRRLLKRISIGALAFSLVIAGAAAGWWARGATDSDDSAEQLSVVVERPLNVVATGSEAATTTPNVIGLTSDQGTQVMTDAGIGPDAITTVAIPAGGEPGRIVDQDPKPGATAASAVTLFVSEAVALPDLTGVTLQEAQAQLEDLGVRAVIERRYDPAVPEDTVIVTEPIAGEPTPAFVTVVVSDAPSSVFLTQLDPIDRSCSVNDVAIAGQEYAESLVCDPDRDEVVQAEYVLNGSVDAFGATIGQSDRGDTNVPVTFRVLVDGAVGFEQSVPFGEKQEISVPTSGALRLVLEVERASLQDESGDVFGAWGDARLLGSRDGIDGVIAESGR